MVYKERKRIPSWYIEREERIPSWYIERVPSWYVEEGNTVMVVEEGGREGIPSWYIDEGVYLHGIYRWHRHGI